MEVIPQRRTSIPTTGCCKVSPIRWDACPVSATTRVGGLVTQTAPDPDAGGPLQASTQSYVYDALGNVLPVPMAWATRPA